MTPNNIVDGYGHFEGMWGPPSHRRGIYIYVYKVHNTRTRETKITAKFNSETNNSCLSSPSACCVRYVTKICKELELNGKHKLLMFVGNIFFSQTTIWFSVKNNRWKWHKSTRWSRNQPCRQKKSIKVKVKLPLCAMKTQKLREGNSSI